MKRKEGIVEQLIDEEGKPAKSTSLKERARPPARDGKPAIAEMAARADKTLAPHPFGSAGVRRADTPEQAAALALLRAAAHLALVAQEQPDEIRGNLKRVRRAANRLEMTLYEEEF